MSRHFLMSTVKELFRQRNNKTDYEAKNWKDEALVDFFGLKKKPVITMNDLMSDESKFKKWIEVQEWKDRLDAYEKFTGEKWGR